MSKVLGSMKCDRCGEVVPVMGFKSGPGYFCQWCRWQAMSHGGDSEERVKKVLKPLTPDQAAKLTGDPPATTKPKASDAKPTPAPAKPASSTKPATAAEEKTIFDIFKSGS